MNEIENAVSAGVHAGNHVGPRHRALRRDARGQRVIRAFLHQPGKVRHLPFLHEFVQELGIHAVDAENDELVLAVPVAAGALAGIEQQCCQQQQQRG